MKKHSKKSWLRFLALIYGITFFFLLVAALVTAHIVSHPELGLAEGNPSIHAVMSEYGLTVGLLLAILYNSAIIFHAWPFFISYLMLKRKYKRSNILADSAVYSWMSAFGLYELIFWLLNAVNDVSWLLFHSCPYVIIATLKLLNKIFFSLTVASFLVVWVFALIVHCYEKKKRIEGYVGLEAS